MYRCGTTRRVFTRHTSNTSTPELPERQLRRSKWMELYNILQYNQVQSTELGPQDNKASDFAATTLQSVSLSLSVSMGTALHSAPLECRQQQRPSTATKHRMLATSSAACSGCSPTGPSHENPYECSILSGISLEPRASRPPFNRISTICVRRGSARLRTKPCKPAARAEAYPRSM